MRKHFIDVPRGTKYLSELVGNLLPEGLPNGIFNKQVCDCGATTLALTDRNKTVICSPRVRLIENKHKQYPNTLVVKKGVRTSDITSYISETQEPKILVTYDSLPKVVKAIRDESEWRVVIDEFHFLLSDSGFKSETEFSTLECLTGFPYVTYLSASPLLEKYVEQIKQFKGADYTELRWKDYRRVSVNRIKTGRPIDAALSIIRKYQKGQFPKIEQDGKLAESKECVIYLNSVTNIVNLIKTCELTPEQVNIIVADNEDNARLIHQLGENYEIGDIPLKGEKHKMFTFCTSTAYAGCDFYSECASSFVICNSKANNMVVDIGRELKQIAGRQRLESNLFRNVIHFVYNTCALDIKEEEFWKAINQKAEITNEAVSFYNKMPARIREKQKRDTQTLQKMMQYGDDYVMYDVLSDCFVFNKMAYLYEKYAYELQKTYRDGIYVKKELEEYGFDASSNLKHLDGLKEQIYYFIRRDSFEEKMKKYCEERKSLFSLSIIEENDERIKAYYDELGAERIKALGYKESALKNEIRLKKMETDIKIMLNQIFYPGVRMSTKDIKAKLSDIYKKAGIKKTAVAKELENYGFILKAVKMVNGEGKRVNGYEMS